MAASGKGALILLDFVPSRIAVLGLIFGHERDARGTPGQALAREPSTGLTLIFKVNGWQR